MTSTQSPARQPINGVNVPALFATLDAVKGQPAIAQFQFRARNEWISGTHSRSTIHGFYGAGQEDTTRPIPFVHDADHPGRPGRDEQRRHPGGVPAARDRRVPDRRGRQHRCRAWHHACIGVSSTVEGDIDLLGILGLSDTVRNGYRQIRVSFEIEGDAPTEQLAALVEQSRRRSAVYDVLANGTDVVVDVHTSAAA